MANHSTAHIYQSLISNFIIALFKAGAAWFTHSGSMMAETIHSFADCGNQVLLLVGVRRSMLPPDAKHPLGYGRDLYFWSFMVALLLFAGGGMFSMYEGVHKLQHPEPVEHAAIGIAILVVSLGIEGAATWANIREMRKRAKGAPLLQYVRDSKDSDLIVVFGENSAATVGLVLAIAAMAMASITGEPRWDAAGSLAIGVVLVFVAIFLAKEVKSLLVGEAADPHLEAAVLALVVAHPDLDKLMSMITIQQGPGQVMLSMKIEFRDGLSMPAGVAAIADFERQLAAACPEVKWCFVEPGLKHLEGGGPQ